MSSYYGIVFPEFWTGPTGRAIRSEGGKDGQILALYLMSCRHATMIGLYRLLTADIQHETGLGAKGMVRGFDVLAQLAFAEYDLRTEHVWVREMAKFRLGLQKKSPLDSLDNRIKAVQNMYDRMPENPFLEPFFDRYAAEVRLQGRRTCSFAAEQPHMSPLGRGSRTPCKPDNRSQVQGSETGTGKSTGAARRPVEISVENSPGTFGLYCVIAEEALGRSIRDDQDDSLGNIAEWMKTLCAQRRIAYDGDAVRKAIEAVLRGRERTSVPA